MSRTYQLAALLMLTAMTTAPATAKEKIDPAAYPELAQDVLLPAIMTALKHQLSDAYSIREMVMCPAHTITLKDGHPDSWAVSLEFNTKNELGGYIGIKAYTIVFKHGRISGPIYTSSQEGNMGFAGIINRSIDRYYEHCPAVTNAAVQAALQSR